MKHEKYLTGNIEKSTANVCNAMVHNPIYAGPVYESVQSQFESLTSTTQQAAGITDNSACNNQSSTTTTVYDSTVRYADPPVQRSKIRSNSFVSIPPHSSTSNSDAENVSQSTRITIPAINKNGKERNKLHLTLPYIGHNLNINAEPQPSQNHNPLSIDKEMNQVVLIDADENYTVMSPVGVLANSMKDELLCELSP